MRLIRVPYLLARSFVLSFIKHFYTLALLYRMEIGRNVRIDFPINVRGRGKIRLGNNSRLGYGSFINCMGSLEVGDTSHIQAKSVVFIGKVAKWINRSILTPLIRREIEASMAI